MKPKILIVDDEKPLRDTLAKWFKPSYEALTAPDAAAALELIKANPDLQLMISDVKMPGENGVELLKKAKALRPDLATILLTAYGTVDLAVEAMKVGASDFFQKPITDLPQFEARVAKTIKLPNVEKLETFTGESEAMEKVYSLIRKAAPTSANVLIEGPSGTGKELVARALHNLSERAKGPFIAVECSAFSEELLKSELFGYEPGTFTGGLKDGKPGCFEQSEGGTLFLDEIGEIDLGTQVALLRTIESKSVRRLGGGKEKKVDFRLVAATNKDLKSLVKAGTFREDLYYRLNVIDLHLPALKDRAGDIALLTNRFLKEFSKGKKTIDTAAMAQLEAYSWPGNVRELRNVIEKMVVLSTSDVIGKADLPPEIAGKSLAEVKESTEIDNDDIHAALLKSRGNKSKAAELLGISRRTLYRKLKEMGEE